MTSHYTILSLFVRPEIQEKISIGVIMYDSEKVFFKYSKNKLQVAKDLVSEASMRSLKETIKNIDLRIILNKSRFAKPGLFATFPFDKAFTPSYIDYLNRYSNNIVSFSESKIISIETTYENLESLYHKYVDSNADPIHAKVKTLELLKSKYSDKIERYYKLEREINHTLVPNLITPVKIDLSGKNEIDVYVQTLDMEQNYNHISNDINSFLQLKNTYANNKQPMQDFLVAQEPSKRLIKQHDIWNQLNSVNTFNLIDISESDKIIEYAESHGVKPLE